MTLFWNNHDFAMHPRYGFMIFPASPILCPVKSIQCRSNPNSINNNPKRLFFWVNGSFHSNNPHLLSLPFVDTDCVRIRPVRSRYWRTGSEVSPKKSSGAIFRPGSSTRQKNCMENALLDSRNFCLQILWWLLVHFSKLHASMVSAFLTARSQMEDKKTGPSLWSFFPSVIPRPILPWILTNPPRGTPFI